VSDNAAIAIVCSAFCLMLGLACIATRSTDPLWALVLLVFVVLAL
jgi:hypothetical protein